jgi:hypothetical protein
MEERGQHGGDPLDRPDVVQARHAQGDGQHDLEDPDGGSEGRPQGAADGRQQPVYKSLIKIYSLHLFCSFWSLFSPASLAIGAAMPRSAGKKIANKMIHNSLKQ